MESCTKLWSCSFFIICFSFWNLVFRHVLYSLTFFNYYQFWSTLYQVSQCSRNEPRDSYFILFFNILEFHILIFKLFSRFQFRDHCFQCIMQKQVKDSLSSTDLVFNHDFCWSFFLEASAYLESFTYLICFQTLTNWYPIIISLYEALRGTLLSLSVVVSSPSLFLEYSSFSLIPVYLSLSMNMLTEILLWEISMTLCTRFDPLSEVLHCLLPLSSVPFSKFSADFHHWLNVCLFH